MVPSKCEKLVIMFINLVIGDFVHMYLHEIHFYDTISKLGHKGQCSKSHVDTF